MLPTLWARCSGLKPRNTVFLRGLHQSSPQSQTLLNKRLPPSFSALRNLPHGAGILSSLRGQTRSVTGVFAARRTSFDPRFFSSNAAEIPAQELPVLSPPSVGGWLLGSAVLVFAVIVVGGVTRLTESGLSITEWKPISGILPPLTQAQWQEEFEKYKATPEFKLCVSSLFQSVVMC